MDKINFTGYRNVGALKLEFNHPTLSNFRRMMIELTDDGIADLQADIATAEDEKFRASSRYINSEECVRNFTQNDAIDFNITNDINYKNLHAPHNVKENGEIFCIAYSSYADNITRICG